MTEQTIEPIKKFAGTNLYNSFLLGDEQIRKYLVHNNPEVVAEKIGSANVDKSVICDILVRQNKKFGSKPKTFEAIEKYRRSNTLCIFAGQQAGLLGGPLLTIYKMIDIVKRAALLESQLKRPVVPIFWIACDDHDFEEINHTWFINHDNELEKISYEIPDESSVAVAELCMIDEAGYDAFKEQIEKAFTGSEFTGELLSRIMSAYSRDNNIVKAFALHLTDILPDMGLILFCPHNKEVKTLSKDFFKQIIERYFTVRDTLTETSKNLLADNFHVQADKKESSVHMFYHDPVRSPIHYLDESFKIGDKTLGLPGLLDLIERNPEKFSPDVLTRPIWQSYLFPVVAQSSGPSEIAYFCQIGKLFDLFNVPQPYYNARAGATLIEKRHEDLLKKLNINPEELRGDIEQVINRVAEESFPEDIKEAINDFRDKFEHDYNKFSGTIVQYESSLESMADQTFGKIDFALNNFEKKIFAQHKKHMETVRAQIYKLANALYPNKDLQERYLNINQFISKYGYGIVKYLGRTLDVTNSEHQMVYLSEYEEKK